MNSKDNQHAVRPAIWQAGRKKRSPGRQTKVMESAMTDPTPLSIFASVPPGLETALAQEVVEQGFSSPVVTPGGVSFTGTWQDVWRANLVLRGATRILVRIAEFRALHLAQLDKRARRVPWGEVLRRDIAVRVEASCRKSRIYHAGAAAERVANAIADERGAPIAEDAKLSVMVRIESDLVTISVDTSGELLFRRGHKQAVGKAPMRETLAALFLRQCAYTGSEPVLDPMCGSGTFLIEAAEIATGLAPGRARAFAFEHLASFDAEIWRSLQSSITPRPTTLRFVGSDRNSGAIEMSRANAERAGVGAVTDFSVANVGDITPPGDQPPGLIIVNPPYGGRIGEVRALAPLYAALGRVAKERFPGWRVGLVTTEATLAKATGLPFKPPGPPIDHGGLRIKLWQTGAL